MATALIVARFYAQYINPLRLQPRGPVILKAYVSKPVLLAFCGVGIFVGTVVTAARLYVRFKRHRKLLPDDYAHLLAVALYYTLCGLYVGDSRSMYSFLDYTSGDKPFDTSVPTAYTHMLRYNFAVTTLFWAVLWAVKLNLLLLFWKLLRDTGKKWCFWIVTATTFVTFVGCIISQYLSCDSLAEFTVLGACTSSGETRAQTISLYLACGFDILTEILVMLIPLQLLKDLRKSKYDKLRLASLFTVGIFTVIVSLIRVFLIYAKTGSTTPSPAWLGLWAIIECMTAIIAGAIPSISQMFRQGGTGSIVRYGSSGQRLSGQGQGSSRRASVATNPRTSMLNNLRASLNKQRHALDNVSIESFEAAHVIEKGNPSEPLPTQKLLPYETVSIEREVFIEKQPDTHEKDDDFHRWMLKSEVSKPKSANA